MMSQRGKSNLDQRVVKAVIETLEKRQLLTTVHGGEVFEFIQYDDSTVRVSVTGPATASLELIGATENNTGNGSQFATLNQVPGRFTTGGGQNPDKFGGLGGADGVEPIDTITGAPDSLTDVNATAVGGQNLAAPRAAIHYDAMSSNSAGKTYAISLQDVGDNNQVWLTSVNYTQSGQGTVVQNLAGQILAATPLPPGSDPLETTDIQSIVAADFLSSNDQLLYFVAVVTVPRRPLAGGEATDTDVPFLFRVNLGVPDPTASIDQLGLAIRSDPFSNAAEVVPDVFGMTFNDEDQLIMSVTGREVGGTGDTPAAVEKTGVVVTDYTDPQFSLNQVRTVVLGQDTVDDLRGIEAVPGDTGFIYGISGDGASSELLHVNYNAGVAADFGGLSDPDDQRDDKRGEALTDLVWNPRLLNAFRQIDDDATNDSRRGALIAQDSTTDELVFVDTTQRFATTSLYAMYLSNATPDTRVSISVVSDTNPRPMTPFTGSIGTIRHPDAQTGELVTSSPAAGTGELLVGLRTIDVLDNTNDEEDLPVRRIRKTPSQTFGNFPVKSKYIYAGVQVVGDVGNFLIAGTVLGRVAVEGSIAGTLYAGSFLTGDPAGRAQATSYGDVAGNIYVSGDARNIIARSSIGSTDTSGARQATYLTGADVYVGGKLGQLLTLDAMYGNVNVVNNFGGLNTAITEVEDRRTPPTGRNTYFEGYGGVGPSLGDVTDFRNDTVANAQYVGTHLAKAYRNDETTIINGSLDNATNVSDELDYYAMSLLGGQTITVRLDTESVLSVGVIDSEGRMIATDRSDIGAGAVGGKEFQVKIDRPGTYRFVVGFTNDPELDGNPVVLIGGPQAYTLRITGQADIAAGGIVAQNGIRHFDSTALGVFVANGDLGSVVSKTAAIIDSTLGYSVLKGNVRSIEAATEFGSLDADGIIGNGLALLVPAGTVGRLRTTGTMMLNHPSAGALLNYIDASTGLPDPTYAIGGDYQWIDAGGEFRGSLMADRGIGNFHAGSVFGGGYFIANADRTGNDGIVDIFDVTGDFGDGANGGPSIYTGPGGNWRYLDVGGLTWSPPAFGRGQRQATVYDPGETVRLIDDSGTEVKLTPTPRVVGGSATDPTALLNPGTLGIITYPVSDTDKNGVIITFVGLDITGTTNAANHGLLVETGGEGVGGSVEIAEIQTFEDGRIISETSSTAVDGTTTVGLSLPVRAGDEGFVAPTASSPVDLVFKGKSPIDVWQITAFNRAGTALANLDSINNSTSGEIVNVSAHGIGDISAETIGLASTHTGANKSRTGNSVRPNVPLAIGGGPNATQDTGIVLTPVGTPGYLISARSRQAIGNIFVQGIIGSVVANSNKKDVKGSFEGIVGPILATSTASPTTGRIISVNIGEGLAPTGSGTTALSGLFAGTTITSIVNQGAGSDIRGDVVVGFAPPPVLGPDALSIGSIELTNGSIINADIMITNNVRQFNEGRASLIFDIAEALDTVNNPTIDLKSIVLSGNGGIIGSTITAADMGDIVVEGGFGILNSAILSEGDDKIQNIDVTGYGIRDSAIGRGATIDNITVRGTGKLIDANFFEGSVRQSGGKQGFDAYTGQLYNELNDLHRYLGTNDKVGKIKGVSKDGIIEDSEISGTRELGKLSAYQIVGRQKTTRIQFANKISNITTTHGIDNMLLSTGTLKKLNTGYDVSFSQIGVAGLADQIYIGGTFKGTSRLTVTGAQGKLNNLTTKRGLFGRVNVVSNIGTIHVGTDLGSVQVKGLANMASLIVDGDVLSGSTTDMRGALSQIAVGGDVQDNAVIRAKSNTEQVVKGDLLGDIIIG